MVARTEVGPPKSATPTRRYRLLGDPDSSREVEAGISSDQDLQAAQVAADANAVIFCEGPLFLFLK